MRAHYFELKAWTSRLAVLTIILWIGMGGAASAVDVYDPGKNPAHTLSNYHNLGYIGGPGDDTEFAKKIYALLKKEEDNPCDTPQDEADKTNDRMRVANGLKALKLIKKEITWNSLSSDEDSAKKQISSLIESTIDVFTSILDPEFFGDVSNWKIESDLLEWTPLPGTAIDFQRCFLEGRCTDPKSTECQLAYRNAVDALRISELTYRCITYMVQSKALNRAQVYFKERNKQWDIYFNASIPQWPWELAINGYCYGKEHAADKGSNPPPENQIIFLHPDVVIEYVPEADDGQQFEPAVMMEWLGADFWTWNSANQSGPFFGYPLGIGFVSTFADRADMNDLSWGGILHINHTFNVGVTVRDGDIGYFVSANLSKLFMNEQVSREKLKQIRDK